MISAEQAAKMYPRDTPIVKHGDTRWGSSHPTIMFSRPGDHLAHLLPDAQFLTVGAKVEVSDGRDIGVYELVEHTAAGGPGWRRKVLMRNAAL